MVGVRSVVLEGSGIELTLILRLEMHNIGSQIRVLYDRPKSLIFKHLNRLKMGFKLT
jgi:hypothetical protein